MKKKLFLASLLVLILGYSCQNDFVGSDDASDHGVTTRSLNEDLSVASAKAYFEAKAHTLELPNFDSKVAAASVCTDTKCTVHHHEHDIAPPQTKKAKLPELKKSNIVLEWKKSRSWSDKHASYVEVPMNVGGQLFALKKTKKGNENLSHERSKVENRLIFHKPHG